MLRTLFPFQPFRRTRDQPLTTGEVFAEVVTAPKVSNTKHEARSSQDKKDRLSIQDKYDVMNGKKNTRSTIIMKIKRASSTRKFRNPVVEANEVPASSATPNTITRALLSVKETVKSKQRARSSNASSGFLQNWLNTPWDERANTYPTPYSGNSYTVDEYEERGSWITTPDEFVCDVPECQHHGQKKRLDHRPRSQATRASFAASEVCSAGSRRGTPIKKNGAKVPGTPMKSRKAEERAHALQEVSNTPPDRNSCRSPAKTIKFEASKGREVASEDKVLSGKISTEQRRVNLSRDEALDFYSRSRRFI